MLKDNPESTKKAADYRPRQERMGGIAVVSHDALLREGLASLIEQEGPFRVVARCETLTDCLSSSAKNDAHVILIDANGLEASEKALLPGIKAMGTLKLVSLDHGRESLDTEAKISRDATKLQFLKVLRDATATIRRSGVRESRALYGPRLTPREYDVARLVAQGFSNRRISQRLELREQSVKNLVSVIMRKMQCENRVQVALHLTSTNLEG